tara:strand:+ start:54026 stop:54823 length:798 start_codon:yes stop_codon:yes gene_type:complete
MNNNSIGVFDSGLGGLTVVKAIRKLLSSESLLYFGDTARLPYGSKSPETVISSSKQVVNFLIQRDIKLMVVACNSATAMALPVLLEMTSIPIIGVIEPGAKAAVDISKSNHIGVIGTHATIHSGAYNSAIKEINPNCIVTEQPCPLFVPLVEEGWADHPIASEIAKEYLQTFNESFVDVVILGCTHYPLMKKIIKESLNKNVKLVDSATSVANEIKRILEKNNLLAENADPTIKYFVTDFPQKFEELGKRFIGKDLKEVSLANID